VNKSSVGVGRELVLLQALFLSAIIIVVYTFLVDTEESK
jgi:hypothetical protein